MVSREAWCSPELRGLLEKLHFPYLWLRSTSQLQQKEFPSIEEFNMTVSAGHLELSGADDHSEAQAVLSEAISESQYSKVKAFYDENFNNFGVFLMEYNRRDVIGKLNG